jgi:KDO2-lipid IV(A) lauroyltransferase
VRERDRLGGGRAACAPRNRPIVFVTPHLGGYDVAGRYLWTHLPILAMYRPHKIFWLDQLIREGATAARRPTAPTSRPRTLARRAHGAQALAARRLQRRAAGPGPGRAKASGRISSGVRPTP